MSIPVINIGPLNRQNGDKKAVAKEIAQACKKSGFFYIENHGVSNELIDSLEELSREFFRLPESVKNEISMSKGGKAWRGYFPLEGELTSGKADLKEGLYFGAQLPNNHPYVRAGLPLHGPNLFPDIIGFETAVLAYMKAMTHLGKILMQAVALSLDLPLDYFESTCMKNPITLFRVFHYPPPSDVQRSENQWGVGEHTDYGVLTILKQDDVGGLQVYSQGKWIEAPYIKDTFICNIGDMLDLMTGGYYRSTPHRVNNRSQAGRLSLPFFFDLDFSAKVEPIDLSHWGHNRPRTFERWDASDLHGFEGTYGDYLVQKVLRVFPKLPGEM